MKNSYALVDQNGKKIVFSSDNGEVKASELIGTEEEYDAKAISDNIIEGLNKQKKEYENKINETQDLIVYWGKFSKVVMIIVAPALAALMGLVGTIYTVINHIALINILYCFGFGAGFSVLVCPILSINGLLNKQSLKKDKKKQEIKLSKLEEVIKQEKDKAIDLDKDKIEKPMPIINTKDLTTVSQAYIDETIAKIQEDISSHVKTKGRK